MPRTILLADDSVTIRRVVELTFSDSGIRVESVASGREALDRLEAVRPDLVLADVGMSPPSGYEVCQAVKASSRPVPVVLLAGAFEPYDPDRAHQAGADGHVTKPFDARALVALVESLLASPPGPPATSAHPATANPTDLEEVLDDLAAPPAGPSTPSAPPPAAPPAGIAALSPDDLDALAREVVARLSDRVLREIAWEVVPELAEIVVKERLAQLERDGSQ